eukprot:350733-Chlamydomonas_euryale.AAC.2
MHPPFGEDQTGRSRAPGSARGARRRVPAPAASVDARQVSSLAERRAEREQGCARKCMWSAAPCSARECPQCRCQSTPGRDPPAKGAHLV